MTDQRDQDNRSQTTEGKTEATKSYLYQMYICEEKSIPRL
jgi:hypothetical protein